MSHDGHVFLHAQDKSLHCVVWRLNGLPKGSVRRHGSSRSSHETWTFPVLSFESNPHRRHRVISGLEADKTGSPADKERAQTPLLRLRHAAPEHDRVAAEHDHKHNREAVEKDHKHKSVAADHSQTNDRVAAEHGHKRDPVVAHDNKRDRVAEHDEKPSGVAEHDHNHKHNRVEERDHDRRSDDVALPSTTAGATTSRSRARTQA